MTTRAEREHPFVGQGGIGALIGEMIAYRSLLRLWTLREVRVRYKQSMLGASWAIFQPLSQAMILSVVFTLVVPVNSGSVPYPLFVYVGLLPWTLFVSSVGNGTSSLISNSNLVSRVYFPREILPMAAVGAALLDFAVASLMLAGMMLYYQWPLRLSVLWIIPLLVIELCLILGLVFACSALMVFRRDFRFVIPLLLQLWMYATPVIYPLESIPPPLQPLFAINPMTAVMTGFRDAILHGYAPSSAVMWPAVIISVVVACAGYWLFKRLEGGFADAI